MTANLRALLVTYVFPPTGGAGVARTLKLSKFLPNHGVVPSVLTVSNPSVPSQDVSLLSDVRPEMTIVRTPTLEPGYKVKQAVWDQEKTGASAEQKAISLKSRLVKLGKQLLTPDPQVLWQPSAQVALAKRLAQNADDVVFISAPPFSQFLLAPLVRASRHARVVLDYRDEWSTYRTSYEMMSKAAALTGRALEEKLLRCAHAVTTATPEFRENLLASFPFLAQKPVVAIPNGYDPADFPSPLPSPPLDKFVITYAGTVFKLTSPGGFIQAMRLLQERAPHLAKRLDVRFIGRIVETEQPLFEDTEQLGVRRLGYMDKHAVTRELSASHLVLCTLDDVPGTERIYPGKIFELMFLRRPILTLAPSGALTRLCADHGLGAVIAPRDVEAIANYLEQQLSAFVHGKFQALSQPHAIEQFHRNHQAGQFAELFRQVCR